MLIVFVATPPGFVPGVVGVDGAVVGPVPYPLSPPPPHATRATAHVVNTARGKYRIQPPSRHCTKEKGQRQPMDIVSEKNRSPEESASHRPGSISSAPFVEPHSVGVG